MEDKWDKLIVKDLHSVGILLLDALLTFLLKGKKGEPWKPHNLRAFYSYTAMTKIKWQTEDILFLIRALQSL